MRPVVRNPAPEPGALHGSGGSCRVRVWSGDPTVAQLLLHHDRRALTADDVRRWCDELARRGFRGVRTGALYPRQAEPLSDAGFTVIQRLALLEHRSPRDAARAPGVTQRLPVGAEPEAATVDRAAFGEVWSLDAVAIAEVRSATPRHRARAVYDGRQLLAFAVSGRDNRLGFLQRLAVEPAAQRHGLGRRLVLDSLRWAGRWRASRVLVNTHVDNDPALALYESTGFVRLPDELVVLERAIAGDTENGCVDQAAGGDR
ncbi:MAG: GNAT family N-acetyltransferase [Ilumatobacteraceae bacterium]